MEMDAMTEQMALKLLQAKLAKVHKTVANYGPDGSHPKKWLTKDEVTEAVKSVKFGEKKGEAWTVALPCRACGSTAKDEGALPPEQINRRGGGDIYHNQYCPACTEAGAGRKLSPKARELLAKATPEQISEMLASLSE